MEFVNGIKSNTMGSADFPPFSCWFSELFAHFMQGCDQTSSCWLDHVQTCTAASTVCFRYRLHISCMDETKWIRAGRKQHNTIVGPLWVTLSKQGSGIGHRKLKINVVHTLESWSRMRLMLNSGDPRKLQWWLTMQSLRSLIVMSSALGMDMVGYHSSGWVKDP